MHSHSGGLKSKEIVYEYYMHVHIYIYYMEGGKKPWQYLFIYRVTARRKTMWHTQRHTHVEKKSFEQFFLNVFPCLCVFTFGIYEISCSRTHTTPRAGAAAAAGLVCVRSTVTANEKQFAIALNASRKIFNTAQSTSTDTHSRTHTRPHTDGESRPWAPWRYCTKDTHTPSARRTHTQSQKQTRPHRQLHFKCSEARLFSPRQMSMWVQWSHDEVH